MQKKASPYNVCPQYVHTRVKYTNCIAPCTASNSGDYIIQTTSYNTILHTVFYCQHDVVPVSYWSSGEMSTITGSLTVFWNS